MAKKPSVETQSSKVSNDRNTDELNLKKVQQSSNKDADFQKVKFAYSQVGDYLLELGETINSQIVKTFGAAQPRPKLKAISAMYNQLTQKSKPEDYIPILEDFKNHSPGSLDELFKAKFVYEKNTHKNQNSYMKASIKGGSDMENAKANWQLAVSTYLEERQNAELVMKEAVYASRKSHKDVAIEEGDLETKLEYNVDYFSEASEIATALGNYGKSMNTSNTSLATAFAALLTAFNSAWNDVATGELELILNNRNDSKTLWTSIEAYYKKKFGSK